MDEQSRQATDKRSFRFAKSAQSMPKKEKIYSVYYVLI